MSALVRFIGFRAFTSAEAVPSPENTPEPAALMEGEARVGGGSVKEANKDRAVSNDPVLPSSDILITK
jgi:hypothetical protein